MPNLTEAQLIEKVRLGDQLAFKKLIEMHQRFIYSVAFRFTRNTGDAEDMAQECFVRFWKNMDKYNSDYSLKSWLGKIITNLCLDHIKSVRKKNELNTIGLDQGWDIHDEVHHEKKLQGTELHQIILQLAEQLTPKQKAVFILRDLESLEVQEVCDMLNESAEIIKSNLYHARKYVREKLLKHYKMSLI